ncbi:polyol transporter 5 isoform X2 [Cryptomeria japonica]|uniref:polyol transporter 5 isoform X2 n=1 Tax=Cryptomeria japonica TaxID=3369 RepID=UPI0027DA48F5|nr:polyol transporter 5 isoform X2 [Cryptomeria japonica]
MLQNCCPRNYEDVGVMSGAVLFIRKDLHVNDLQVEMLIGSLNLICLLGSALAGKTSDAVGRRWTMALAALIFFVGAVVMSLAPSFAWLMMGRLVGGVGLGYAIVIAPVYTAELAPASTRGMLTCFPEIFVNLGILLGYVANYAFQGLPTNYNWRVMLGMGAIPPFFIGVFVLFMPESPRWLVMKNRNEDAMKVLLRTSESEAKASELLAQIMEGIQYAQKNLEKKDLSSEGEGDPLKSKGEGTWGELIYKTTPSIRRMLIVGLGIQFFQQASGIDGTVYYSPFTFKKAGINSQNAILGATMAIGFVKTGFIVVAAFFIDKIGRRPLLLISTVRSTVSLAGLGLSLIVVEKTSGSAHEAAACLAVVAACSNVSFFSIGLGPINLVMGSEIYPLRLRAKAVGLGVGVNRLVSGAVSVTFLSLSKAITLPAVFFFYAGFSFMAVGFVYRFVPETKGKTLEEIVELFTIGSSVKTSTPSQLELGSGKTSPGPTVVTQST